MVQARTVQPFPQHGFQKQSVTPLRHRYKHTLNGSHHLLYYLINKRKKDGFLGNLNVVVIFILEIICILANSVSNDLISLVN